MKPYRIILNSSEGPEVRCYDTAEMHIPADGDFMTLSDSTVRGDSIVETEAEIRGQVDKGHLLKEIEVTAKAAPWDIGQIVENATASYDIEAANDALLDDGKRFVRTLLDMLPLIDNKFIYGVPFMDQQPDEPRFQYNGKRVFFVLDKGLGDNALALGDEFDSDFIDPTMIPVESIKNVYVNTKDEVIYEQVCQRFPLDSVDERFRKRRRYGCVVYVELFPEMRVRMKPGMRRTIIEGYSDPVEFYSPDYSDIAPFDTDFRRTLYWNPEVKPDSTGKATIRFYNNSRAKNFGISTATVSADGSLGGN